MLAAHAGIAKHAAVQQVGSHRALIYRDLQPCLRNARRALSRSAPQKQLLDPVHSSSIALCGRISTTTISGTLLNLGTPTPLPSPRESTMTLLPSCEA